MDIGVSILMNGQAYDHVVSGAKITTPAQAIAKVRADIVASRLIHVEWDDSLGNVRFQGDIYVAPNASYALRVLVPWPTA